ncbi:MAG: hypothetical protein QXF15_02030 [Candidatus Aenigmatarchaeota archaeon]
MPRPFKVNKRKWVETAVLMIFIIIIILMGVSLLKLLGLAFIIISFAILLYFPDSFRFQPEYITLAGILIGSLLLIIGAILLLFG